MEITGIMEFMASMGATIGGWELIKYMLNIRSNKRKERAEAEKTEAEATGADFNVLREVVEFLQTQLKEKEERFANQTERLRKIQDDHFELMKKNAQTELELQKYRCIRPKCLEREPQNGY